VDILVVCHFLGVNFLLFVFFYEVTFGAIHGTEHIPREIAEPSVIASEKNSEAPDVAVDQSSPEPFRIFLGTFTSPS
jgi:hypothetical protein